MPAAGRRSSPTASISLSLTARSRQQAANLHRLAQDVYDGVVERIEAKVIEDALAATNAVGAVEQ